MQGFLFFVFFFFFSFARAKRESMVPGVPSGDRGNWGIRISKYHSATLYFVRKA